MHGPRRYEAVATHDRQLLEVFELAPLGRRLQRRMVFTSDQRFTMGTLRQSSVRREFPWARGARHTAGGIFDGVCKNGKPVVPGGANSWDEAVGSVCVYRRRSEASLVWRRLAVDHMDGKKAVDKSENWMAPQGASYHHHQAASSQHPSEFFEEYLPPWCLAGLIPACLLEDYEFWRVGDEVLRGYAKADPAALHSLHVRLVRFHHQDGGGAATSASGTQAPPASRATRQRAPTPKLRTPKAWFAVVRRLTLESVKSLREADHKPSTRTQRLEATILDSSSQAYYSACCRASSSRVCARPFCVWTQSSRHC